MNQTNVVSPQEVQLKDADAKSIPPPSHLPIDLRGKEILYDFTRDMSSIASTSSAQSDIFSDGSMLSSKSPDRGTPSSMELDDGILYDMRISSDSESQEGMVEMVIPKMTTDYVPATYTSESNEEFEQLEIAPRPKTAWTH